MEQDIRDLFKNEKLHKKKLPESHRDEFFEKLQQQNAENPKKRKFYVVLKVAVSIAILISLAYIFNGNDKISTLDIVEEKTDTIDTKFKKKFVVIEPEDVIVFEEVDRGFTNSGLVEKEQLYGKKERTKVQIVSLVKPEITHIRGLEELSFQIMDLEFKASSATINEGDTNRIKVNSDALLYSIYHTPKEVLAYYKENDLTRESVLLAIEVEIENSNLEVDANDLLAEIELGLRRNYFRRNLLDKIELKLKDLSEALANN